MCFYHFMKCIDRVGKKYGRWKVIKRVHNGPHGQTRWLCKCDCGGEGIVQGGNLANGSSQSCGCLAIENSQRQLAKIDRRGMANGRAKAALKRCGENYIESHTRWYKRAAGRFYAAKRKKVPLGFSTPQALAVYCRSITPTHCPALGLKLLPEAGNFIDASVSIDQKIAGKGYVKGNILIISMRANRMKGNATRAELKAFARWVQKEFA